MPIAEEILIEIIQQTQSMIIPYEDEDDEDDDRDDVDDDDIWGAMITILSPSGSSAVRGSTLTAAALHSIAA